MEQINETSFYKKSMYFLSHLGKAALIVLAMGAGFGCSEIYHFVKSKSKAEIPQNVKKMQSTSVAMNERNELMIIDRVDGSYQIFQDSVGMQVFRLYAGRIQQSVNSNSK